MRIGKDIHRTHGYITTSIDTLLQTYFLHLDANKKSLYNIDERSDIFGRSIVGFLSGSHNTTRDLHNFYLSLREDSAYLNGITQGSMPTHDDITQGLDQARVLINNLTPVWKVLRRCIYILSCGTFILWRPFIERATIYTPQRIAQTSIS